MKQLGIEVYDAEGNLKKMAQIIPGWLQLLLVLMKTKNEALKICSTSVVVVQQQP